MFNSPRSPSSGAVFGYGAMDSNPIDGQGTPSDKLRYTNIDIISKKLKCMQLLQQPVDDSMFCAGGQVNNDACMGDSGGPLVVESVVVPDFVALIGVISYGRGNCGSGGFPGVYGNVTKAEQFIGKHVRDVQWMADLLDTDNDNEVY